MKADAMACVFLAIGLWAAGIAIEQEYRGEAIYTVRYGVAPTHYKKAENPRMFRNVMNWEWFQAGGLLAIATLIWAGMRWQDSLDILSPPFRGQDLVDEDNESSSKKKS
jgi:hypothetical protein